MTPAGFGQAGVGSNKCGLGVGALVVRYRMGAAVGVRPLVVPAGSEEGCRAVLLRSGSAVAVCTRQGGGRSQLLSMRGQGTARA